MKSGFGFVILLFHLVPRRASAMRAETSARTVYPPQAGLSPPTGKRASARAGRNGNAQA